MALFTVKKVIDGNTIFIEPQWSVAGKSGSEVIVRGYSLMFTPSISKTYHEDIQRKFANDFAKSRLEELLLNKCITMKLSMFETSDCLIENNQLKCRVYLNDVDISYYFPDYQK